MREATDRGQERRRRRRRPLGNESQLHADPHASPLLSLFAGQSNVRIEGGEVLDLNMEEGGKK